MSDPANSSHGSVLGVGGRLASGPAPELVATAFAHELGTQLPLFSGMSLADLAHTVVLHEAGVIPPEAGRILLGELLALHARPADFTPVPEAGDLYTNREAWLAARTPATGWLGAGRARREATTVGYRLVVRTRLLELGGALIAAGQALVARAGEHRAALMADYTYLQPAQPTTFGHYLLTFAFPLLRDLERLRALFGRTNRSPAGCGSVNGSRLPQNRERLAELLGFDGLAQHARDAMWQPDGPIETLAVSVAALVNLDRLAEDLQIFASAEFGLVELADGHARSSVIMPQKKNPYALSYIRGVTNQLIGLQAAAAAQGRTPSGQVDNRVFAYGDVPQALTAAAGAARLLAGVLGGLRFNAPLAEARLRAGFATATDLAEVICMECGLEFRAAHRVVGRLVRDAVAAGRTMAELSGADLDAAALAVLDRPLGLPADAFAAAVDPRAAVALRRTPGGAAHEPLEAMLAECRAALEAHTTWHSAASARISAAEEALLRLAARLHADGSI